MPSATRCTSLGLMPAFFGRQHRVISPSDFGLLMPNFLPLRSLIDLIGEFGMTMMTLSASEREPISTILISWPWLMAAIAAGRRGLAVAERARDHGAHRGAAAFAGNDAGDVDAGLLEEALVDRHAVRRARRIGLVLGDEDVFGQRRQRRGKHKANAQEPDQSCAATYRPPCGFPAVVNCVVSARRAQRYYRPPGTNGNATVLPDALR